MPSENEQDIHECPHTCTGGAGGTRTPDRQLRRLLLYPLSYSPVCDCTILQTGAFRNLASTTPDTVLCIPSLR